MSVVEQRYRAVLAVLAGASVTETAAQFGVSRQTVHSWLRRYRESGLAGLADRSRRPMSSPSQLSPEVEAVVCELRREHPRWGPVRLVHEAERLGVRPVPSRMGVYRALVRHGLITPRQRRRRREDYLRWERPAPMDLWQMDIVGGVFLADGTEAKIVTGIDDHSRYCVIAAVVARPTGRAVCLAFAHALQTFGVPNEVLTDNGKQFTDRFGKGGEVLFDRICRDNGITHRLTQPRSPTTTGKVERFHQTLRRELLDDAVPFADLGSAQAALDAWVAEYNTRRPHQAMGMACPAERFTPKTDPREELLPLRLPGALKAVNGQVIAQPQPAPASDLDTPARSEDGPGADALADEVAARAWSGGPVEFDRVVSASGDMFVAGRQFWLGPDRAGVTVTFWADTDVIHLLVAGVRLKSFRSHLSNADLAKLAANGGRAAGPAPLPSAEPGTAVEVDRTVSRSGTVSLAGRVVLAAEILNGRRVTVRIEEHTLMFFDPETRELLRTRHNPISWERLRHLRDARPAGPPPRPSVEPVTVQRVASNSGVIMVAGQKVALGRIHARAIVTVHVSDTTLTIELPDDTRVVRRTTTQPVRSIKAARPRKAGHVS
ncbi:IS481 family transposase [Sphaerimonospora sp. CA-214678]|uniref:IS481 family transposase n=1 Tax=Sphaerimonospora sp. CA-214678 TaxID=3240029 RepID=UPI003D8CA8DD